MGEKNATEEVLIPRPRKISEIGELYQHSREKWQETHTQRAYCFGSDEVKDLDAVRLQVHGGELTEENAQAKRRAIIRKARNRLQGSLQERGQHIAKELYAFFDGYLHVVSQRTAFEHSGVSPAVQELLTAFDNSSSTNPLPLYRAACQSPIPPELLEPLLIAHVKEFQRKNEEFLQRVPHLKREFYKRALVLRARGLLPVEEPTLKTRFEQTSVQLADPLLRPLNEIYGQYSSDFSLVEIAPDLPGRLEKHTFAHEMYHAFEGKTPAEWRFSEEVETEVSRRLREQGVQDEERTPFIVDMRSGLQFRGAKEHGSSRFHWLNEALTDFFAAEHTNEKPIYVRELRLLRGLLERGKKPLSHGDFAAAYFEPYDAQEPAGQRLAYWNALMKKITESYGSGFLVKLDKFVQEKGVDEALKTMERPDGWKQIQRAY